MNISNLPPEVVSSFLPFMSINDILSLCETSPQFSYLCQDESVWKMLTIRDFKDFYPRQKGDWKKTYQYYYNKVREINNKSEELFNDIVDGNTLEDWGYAITVDSELDSSLLDLPDINIILIKNIINSLETQEVPKYFNNPQIILRYDRTNREFLVILDIPSTFQGFPYPEGIITWKVSEKTFRRVLFNLIWKEIHIYDVDMTPV